MIEVIFEVEQPHECSYVASALGTSIITEAESVPELRTRVRDAVRCHFDEGDMPKLIRLHFVREEITAA